MPHLIRPNITKVVTKDKNGQIEVHISIDLNLNLNTDNIQLGINGANASMNGADVNINPQKKEPEVDWVIPDFKMGGNIKFGEEKE